MYDIPEDCLLAYDPDDLDLHSNSTDFEDNHVLRVTPKNGNHSLFNKKKTSKFSKDRLSDNLLIYNSQMSKSSSKVLYETETIYNDDLQIHKSYHSRKSQILSGTQIETKLSKRHKAIPSLSGIFKWSNNHITSRSLIKEKSTEIGSQTSHAKREPKLDKIYRKQQYYAVEPLYTIERNNNCAQNNPFKTTLKPKKIRGSTQKTSRDEYFKTVCNLTSSSDLDHQIIKSRSKWTKHIENNTRKGCKEGTLKRQNQKEHRSVTNLVKHQRKFPFQVYTNPQQYTKAPPNNSEQSSATSAVPSTCSGFWDYLFNKINNKYQRVQVYKSCKCCATDNTIKSPCCNTSCNYGTEPNKCCRAFTPTIPPAPPLKVTCSCNTTPEPVSQKSELLQTQTPSEPSAKFFIAPKSQRTNKVGGPNNNSSYSNVLQAPLQQIEGAHNTYGDRPRCQMRHNDLTTALNQKYNGEILCIHNPPCIVINGCLNLPPIEQNHPQPNQTTPVWPLSECSKPSYHNIFKSKKNKKRSQKYEEVVEKELVNTAIDDCCQYKNQNVKQQADKPIKIEPTIIDRSCQYIPQTVDQFQVTEQRTEEKNVQSYCNHVPPCGLQRKCHRPKYDPILYSNCFHVPMCDNIPLCLLDSKAEVPAKTACRHKPACAEVPRCSVDYIVQNAKGEIGTQMRPNTKMVCHHHPPCIMISKCLARMCTEGSMPYDAIPSCVHHPPCEMIPACCRKSAKEMVSVCAQHPNSCRIT